MKKTNTITLKSLFYTRLEVAHMMNISVKTLGRKIHKMQIVLPIRKLLTQENVYVLFKTLLPCKTVKVLEIQISDISEAS